VFISRKAIREFVERHPQSEKSLDAWYRIARQAEWKNLSDVRETYAHADLVGKCTVFNIHGNHYRLIGRINFKHSVIYIRAVLTHTEYDAGEWKDGC